MLPSALAFFQLILPTSTCLPEKLHPKKERGLPAVVCPLPFSIQPKQQLSMWLEFPRELFFFLINYLF